MKILFYDTETTDKLNFHRPHSDPSQPRLVQLGAVLTDDKTEIASVRAIVKPEGFAIPDEAAAVHGITTERALADGLPLATVLRAFRDLANQAELFVCHNSDFDELMMRREFHLAETPWLAAPHFCTMRQSTNRCRIPGPYGFKWPKLSEAIEFAFGEKLEGAHDAMADVRATMRLYWWLTGQVEDQTPRAKGDA